MGTNLEKQQRIFKADIESQIDTCFPFRIHFCGTDGLYINLHLGNGAKNVIKLEQELPEMRQDLLIDRTTIQYNEVYQCHQHVIA